MRAKIFILGLIFLMGYCASIPHYKKKYQDSKTVLYEDIPFEKLWNATVASILELEYSISNIDKDTGFIYAYGEKNPLAWPYPVDAPILNIIVENKKGDIKITCHSKPGDVSLDPEKEIKKFFNVLNKNLINK